MADVDPRVSRLILAHASLGAALNFAASIRTHGPRRAAIMFALGAGLPAVGELLVTNPMNLLRHRTRPRPMGVPLGILLDWYCVVNGCATLAERVLDHLPLDDATKRRALLPVAALAGTSLDLILDPFGLDAGLWEWKTDGLYASEVRGANGRRGVPFINYLGWLGLVAGASLTRSRIAGDERESGRLSVLLLLPYYLVAVVWAIRKRKFHYLIYSSPFPVALYAALRER